LIDTPLETCIERDPKGLYAKAGDHGLRKYEKPEHPELRVETVGHTAEDLADEVIAELRRRRILR